METGLKPSGKDNSGAASTVSPTSKEKSFVVNFPLTRSEIDWLRLQSKRVEEASNRLFDLAEKG